MGWQGEDPGTDIRGGGALALELLVHFAETRTSTFLELMGKERGARSEWEYPFAAAGVNIAYMLVGKEGSSIGDISSMNYCVLCLVLGAICMESWCEIAPLSWSHFAYFLSF